MPSREQLFDGLRKADAAGDPLAAGAFARAIKRMDAPPQTSLTGQFLGGINQGIGMVAEFPYNLGAYATAKITGEPTRTYSERFVGPDPTSAGLRIARSAGNLAGAAIPIGGALITGGRLASKVPEFIRKTAGPVRQAAENLMMNAAKYPAGALLSDFLGGVGAGALGQYSDEAGLPSAVRPIAEVVGGMAGPMAAVPGANLTWAGLKAVGRGLQSGLNAVTEGGSPAKQIYYGARPVRRIAELAENPDAALFNLGREYTVPLTPAQKTGDAGLLSLEQAGRVERPGIDANIGKLNAQNRDALAEQLDAMRGPGGDTLAALNNRVKKATRKISTAYQAKVAQINSKVQLAAENRAARSAERIEYLDNLEAAAMAEADDYVSKLAPGATEEQVSIAYKDALRKAAKLSRDEEKALWDAVDKTIPVKMNAALVEYDKYYNDLPVAYRDLVPGFLPDYMTMKEAGTNQGKFLGLTSDIKQVHALRSRLLGYSRSRDTSINDKTRTIANNIADILLNALGGRGKLDPKLQSAVDFTNAAKSRFGQGAINTAQRTDATGGPRVSDVKTLRSIIGTGKPSAVAGVDNALKAVPESRAAIEDYLKNIFTRAALPADKFNPTAARKFANDNKELLSRFPKIRDDIETAIASFAAANADSLSVKKMKNEIVSAVKAGDRADIVGSGISLRNAASAAADREARYTNPKISYTAKILKTAVNKLFDTALSSERPQAFARSVVNSVKNNKTAMAGLRSATIESLMDKAAVGFTDQGARIISGNKLRAAMTETTKKGVLGQWMTKEQIARADWIAEQLIRIERSEATPAAKGGVSTDMPSKILESVARFGGLAAMSGKISGPGSLRAASMVSEGIKDFMQRMTADKSREALIKAVESDVGMSNLLTRIANLPRNKGLKELAADVKVSKSRIPAWMIAAPTQDAVNE